MKNQRFQQLFKRTSTKIGSVMLAAALVFAGVYTYRENQASVPELVTYVDTDGAISIQPDETPLAAPKVTKSTKTTKKTKNVKLKSASKKTYIKSAKPKVKKTTSKKTSGNVSTTTQTVVNTVVSDNYTKGSKIMKEVTTTKTTITKTVQSNASTKKPDSKPAAASGKLTTSSIAPLLPSNVASAWNQLGFSFHKVSDDVPYTGLFDAKTRSINLTDIDETVYHEMGHFVAFAAGNADRTAAFAQIYNAEKSRYTAYNSGYVLSSPYEYFAESFKNYCMDGSTLKKERPKTYAAIQDAIGKITKGQCDMILMIYGALWK